MSLGNITFNQASSPSADGMIVHDVSVAIGEVGSLSTRTDADTGVITIEDSGHSFEVDDRVDLYWSGGSRRGMNVTVVAGALVTIDAGSGDDLPSALSDVTLIVPTLLDVSVLGTLVEAILLSTTQRGQIVFVGSGATEHYQKELGLAKSWEWEDGNGDLNPITGDQIEGVYVSHDGIIAATMKVGILHNNA